MTTKPISILVIEDEEHYIEQIVATPTLKRLVASRQAVVTTADNLQAAEMRLKESHFDLAICDVFFSGKGYTPISLTKHPVGRLLEQSGTLVIATSGNLGMLVASEVVQVLRPVGLLRKSDLSAMLETTLVSALRRIAPYLVQQRSADEVTWLHISDLHYGFDPGGPHNRQMVEAAFIKDLTAHMQRGLSLDYVFLTGDLAYSGQTEQYAEAFSFLEKVLTTVQVPKECLYIVPGNHDLDRAVIDNGVRSIGLPDNRDDLHVKLLGSSHQMKALLAPFRAFNAALAKFGAGNSSLIAPNGDSSFVRCYEARKLAIIGLNSALGSGITLTNDTVHDKGRLFIGERRLRELTQDLDDSWFRIVLMHHPTDYLVDYDQGDLVRLLKQRADLVLHGHLHLNDFSKITDMERSLRVSPCGSLFQGRSLVNSYSIGSVDTSTRNLRLRYRRYSDLRQTFVKDVETTGDERDGVFESVLDATRQSTSP